MAALHTVFGAPRPRRALAAVALAATAATSGCAASAPAVTRAAATPVTVTFWYTFSQPHEVKGIEDNLARFRKLHPEITVKTRSAITDDDMTKAIDSGQDAPDVVTSFNTDAVGGFCSSNRWIDVTPMLRQAKITPKRTFSRAVMDYTQYDGRRCALPMLTDAFGLYYNKDLFAAAGIDGPPRTLSDLRRDAIALTKYDARGEITTAGFMPLFDTYQATPNRVVAQWQPSYFDGQGRSNLATDPAIRQFFDWQKNLIAAEGGYDRLNRFKSTFGEEFAKDNAFEAGKIAMMFDGEWRTTNLTANAVKFNYGTAPFPVPDELAATYGAGYLAGTVIGITKTSKQQQAAFELVRYLTTDTQALTTFATAIHNVPSTFQSVAAASDLAADQYFRTFLDISASPDSGTTPTSSDGGASRIGFADLCKRWQSGDVTNLKAELAAVDKQIDATRTGS